MTSAVILATIAHWAVPAMSEVMRLPDAVPADGEKSGTVTIVAARDEYEPGSFVVRSDVDLGKVRFELSELRNETGDVFPSEDVDLKFVKVWYQNRNAWFSYFGDTGFKLCPELLVNDEDLVRVDTTKEANYARLVGADGRIREQWLNPPHQMDVRPLTEVWRKGAAFMSMRPDFRDAETLQPVAMPANESKQFFLTVRTRKNTPAGLYRGVVQLKQSNNPSNRTILSIPVAVRVQDFVLPRPKTYLDPERDFLICSYHYLEIARILDENGGDRALAVRQLERILADQVAHGQTMHMLKTDVLHPDGEAAMTIGLMKRVGMRTDTLVGGVWGVKDPQTPVDVQRTDARRRAAAFDDLIGHHRVYLSYGDEPQSAWFDKVRGVMEAYHDAGFGFFLAGDDNMFTRASEFVDWANLAQRPERKERVEFWKQMPDARVAWYGQMHVGPENPAFNRRQNGMAPYLAGYSAFANYAHHLGPYNDDRTTYRPMVFAYGVYGGVLDTIQWEGFREGVDDIRYATALVRLARRAIASGTPSLVRQGRRAIRELATFDPAAGDLATLRAEMTRHILALREAVGDLSEDVPPAAVAVDADALVAKFNVAKEQDFRELATYGNFAASAEKLEGRFASRKAFSDVEAESALVAYWGAGRGADAAALVERLVAASPKMKEAEKVKLRFAARVAVAADGSSEGIVRAVESARDADPKERIAAIEFAGSCANRFGDEGLLRRLWDARQAQFAPKPRRTMDVAYVRERMLGSESWAHPGLPASAQKLDRSYGGNLDFLVTDIATGGRGVSAQDAAKAVSEKPTVAAVCDDWGVHFRFVETNADAMRIERGEKSGGSWEIYLAPGADAPHTCLLLNVAPGAEVECANTQYETFGVRRLRTGRDSTRSQVVFSDGRIETCLSVSWENYGVRSLAAAGEWEFEALRWGNAGNAAWNGTESIHGRSTWGRLRFALPAAARARIARRLLSKAVAAYRREKNSEKTFEGTIARWNDPGNGDAAFYAERVRPLEQELDALCARVDAGLSDDEVLALAQEKLNALRDVRHRIAVLRADWLKADCVASVEKNEPMESSFPRANWLEKAEALKPTLFRRDVKPVRMVRIVSDPAAFRGWSAVDAGPCEEALRTGLKAGDALVFDFGEHLVGHLSFRLGEANRVMDAPCRLKLTFAELPGELGPLPKSWQGLCRSWFPDETVNVDFAPVDFALPRRYAFRYVKVEVLACPKDVPTLEWIKATAETSADESRLVQWRAPSAIAERIDRVACRTLRDCMQTIFEDGPKRDRRLWLGDLRIEALADYETYRNFDIVKRSIYLLAGTAKDDGRVGTDAYERPFPKPGGCKIYDYTALFPTVVLEYLEASGDHRTAEDLWPLCKRQAELVMADVDSDGLVRTTGDWWYFIDHDKALDRQVPEQGAVIFGLKGLVRLAQALGRTDEIASVPQAIEQMSQSARKRLWKPERGVFCGDREADPSCLGQAWMVLAGVPSETDARRCLQAVLESGSARRPRTPYGYHYLVEALYVAGLRNQADALLVSYWGGMLEKGADTFWEAYDPADDLSSPYSNVFLNSACHAWSCGPSYFLRNARYRALSSSPEAAR